MGGEQQELAPSPSELLELSGYHYFYHMLLAALWHPTDESIHEIRLRQDR